MANVYFELTRELNESRPVVALCSGQAVVYYRLAMASKDGDWVIREDEAACRRVLAALASRGARYRLCAPLDLRWLRGGWSSHFQFLLDERLRVRCDFFSRPPRLTLSEVAGLFAGANDPLLVIGLEQLVRLKRTQRAKDYPIIGELARLLPPERELELTTDADRIAELAREHGASSTRPCVVAAREGRTAEEVELALVREMRLQRQEDHARVERYARAARPYLAALVDKAVERLPLMQAHEAAVDLAERLLPRDPLGGGTDAAAQ